MTPISSTSDSFANIYQAPREGLTAARQRFNEAASKVSRGDLDPKNFVDLMVSEKSFAANGKVLKAADEMAGTLLNTLA